MRSTFGFWVSCALAVGGCASAKEDAPPPVATQEVVAGGARLRGGGMRMDVVVGRPFVQKKQRGAGIVVKPASTVTP